MVEKPLQGVLSAVFCTKLCIIHGVRLVCRRKMTNFLSKSSFCTGQRVVSRTPRPIARMAPEMRVSTCMCVISRDSFEWTLQPVGKSWGLDDRVSWADLGKLSVSGNRFHHGVIDFHFDTYFENISIDQVLDHWSEMWYSHFCYRDANALH